MLRGVIFDLGSTLVSHEYYNRWPDLRPKMIESLAADLVQQGLAVDSATFNGEFSRNFYDFDSQRQTHFKEITSEYTLRATLEALKLDPNGLDVGRALAAFFAPSETLWTPMPGVYAMLDSLRDSGLKLAIVSNAADNANVQRMIDNANLRNYFDPIVVSAAAGIRKPNPHIFDPVLAAWGFAPAEIAMIGDTLGADVLGAKHVGMKSVWVTMEADTPANIAHKDTILPDAVADSLEKLPSILKSL
jgi:HAD superfamily hydrolase (TIGR01662 family)